jgi:predicted nucleic acid-binding protein
MPTQADPGLGRPVLIDTNAWIEALAPGGDAACRECVERLVQHRRAATCEVVIAEVLRGAQDEAQAAAMEEELRVLHCLPCEGMGATAAAMGRQLHAPRRLFADLLIAAVAFENDAGLLTHDVQLSRVAAAFGIPTESG